MSSILSPKTELTIVITTSCIKSHPSTDVIDKTIGSFSLVDGLEECPIIIVCDGYEVVRDNQREAYKKSMVHENAARNYMSYLDNILLFVFKKSIWGLQRM